MNAISKGITGLALLLGIASAWAQGTRDELAKGFANPPDSAKPRTWWHWTNGNISEPGITRDLEWMQRSGIGGFQLVDVGFGAGQTVEPKIYFGTPEWYHALRHSAAEAKRLGLEMSIFSSPGWSEAGGPWVTPAMAMKRLVWSSMRVNGPLEFSAELPLPPSNEGPIRDAPSAGWPETLANDPHFYADSALFAYRTPEADTADPALAPRVISSNGAIDAAALLDGSLATTFTLTSPREGTAPWIQFEYAHPFTARAFSLGSPKGIPIGRLLAGDDPDNLHTVVEMPGPQGYHGALVRTFAFPATTAKLFRVVLEGAPLTPAAIVHGAPAAPAAEYVLSEAMLFSDARVNRWEDKGAFASLMDVYDVAPTATAPASAEIAHQDVIDLTGKIGKDGMLHWQVPTGNWTIVRMGYTLTGAKNRPPVSSGSGLEVDKLNRSYVKQYFANYFDPIAKELGPLAGSTLQFMTMDSWEAGMQNWTDDMLEQFRRRRGYDPRPYLPVLTGRVVETADVSDRFLWDFRRTLADMYADEFYGSMEDELHKRGMQGYAEASGVALEIPEDTLLNKSSIDIPMAEFWVKALHPESMYYVDVRGAASAAHAYDKPIIAAEAFTGGGYESPYTLKKIADYWFAQGVNRLVFHTSAEQPLDTKPGNTMVGTHLNRNITWAEEAKPFMTYIARASYMLQQGNPVADLAYLLPEGAPSTMPFWGAGLEPAPPAGYDYDYINTDVLLHRTHVDPDGRIRVGNTSAYRLLALPPTTLMTPEVLRKLGELVKSGATILGARPVHSPSLAHYPDADREVEKLATDLWGDMDGVTRNQHIFGKGTVFWGLNVDEVLNRLKANPDFAVSNSGETPPAWIHRQSNDTNIYFVANQADVPVQIEPRFRISDRHVEIFRPMDGSIDSSPYHEDALLDERTGNRQPGIQPAAFSMQKGFTIVPLHLAERESVFVVFRKQQPAARSPAHVHSESRLGIIPGPWTLTFPSHSGAPTSIQMKSLTSWTESADPGVKYFSGTATYSTTFYVPAKWIVNGHPVLLDFEKIHDLAEIKLNGKSLGTLWAPPYQVDLTSSLRPGRNTLAIAVTNEWTNRLIGDRTLPPEQRILAQPPAPTFPGASSALPDSGLMGAVKLMQGATR